MLLGSSQTSPEWPSQNIGEVQLLRITQCLQMVGCLLHIVLARAQGSSCAFSLISVIFAHDLRGRKEIFAVKGRRVSGGGTGRIG